MGGKAILVTGGGQGIGKAHSQAVSLSQERNGVLR